MAIQCDGDGLFSKLWRGVIWDFRFVLCNTWMAPSSFKHLIPSMTITKIPPLTFCNSCFAPHYHNHQTNTEIIPNIKRQVCILFVGAARFLYRTLCRCRSARSMHAPEKSDIHRQVNNPYLYPYYHFVHQKDFLLTHTPIFEVSQLRPRCSAI